MLGLQFIHVSKRATVSYYWDYFIGIEVTTAHLNIRHLYMKSKEIN